MSEPLRREIDLRCSPARAFSAFVDQVDLWWPRGHRRSEGSRLSFEPGPGGRLVDTGPGGAWTMADVVAFEPPARLALDWYPGSASAPTRVEVTFSAHDGGTMVCIVHTAPSAGSAAVWPERVAQFTRGWDAVLAALASAVLERGDE